MQRFEYKVLDVSARGWWKRDIDHQELADKLNELGREGWEVVSCTDINTYEGASRSVVIILKRLINDN